MKTLIELYDERPIENVLGTEMMHPEETILVCPPEMMRNRAWKNSLIEYFKARNCEVKLTFMEASLLDAQKVKKTLQQILSTHEECAFDISGGSDAALFAAGAVAGEVPVFTYSWKKNAFFEIQNAPFARNLLCSVKLDARSCFLMAGGELLPGREDNERLKDRMEEIGSLFSVYSQFRTIWNRQITYIQRISQAEDRNCGAYGPRRVKADNRYVTADEPFFHALEEKKLIQDLHISEKEVSFAFPDEVIRFWLRDVGSVLELQVYRACLSSKLFDDVVLSAVVAWDRQSEGRDNVTNEIDVMAVRGVEPIFISCKTSGIHTEALNELAILRDRFGGKSSRAMIVTAGNVGKTRRVMLRRAQELNIEVVEENELELDTLIERLQHFTKK